MNRLDRQIVEELIEKRIANVEQRRYDTEIIGEAFISDCWHPMTKRCIIERHAGEIKIDLVYCDTMWIKESDCIFYKDRDKKAKAKIERRIKKGET